VFLLTGLTAILFPQYTQMLAQQTGVGRGTDLVMYFFIISAVFFGVLFFAKLSRVERCQTEIVRAIAIASASPAPPSAGRTASERGGAGPGRVARIRGANGGADPESSVVHG
jgi:Uncharacterized conserved protein (DUF2304)